MQPDPIVPTVELRRVPVRRARRGGGRQARGVGVAFVATVALLLLAIAPASAATVDRSWRAKVGTAGANGAVTVVAYTSDTGAATLRLTSLPRSTVTAVTLRAGTCAKPGAVAVTLAPARSSSAGTLNGTRSLAKSAVTRLRRATSLIATVRAGSWMRCATLARLAVPSPSPSPGSAGIEVKAAGFAFAPTSLAVDAGLPFSVTFRNDDAGVPHGFDVGTSATSTPLFAATVITGRASETFTVHGLAAGTYVFYCPIHPTTMHGTLTVGGVGSTASPSPLATASGSPTLAPSPTVAPTPPAPPTPEPTYTGY
jgi:plastocyanin